jgi:dihydrofolate reductase
VVKSIDEGLVLCGPEEEVFIVGGAEIYRQAMPLTDRIYLNHIDQAFDGDTFFPEIDYPRSGSKQERENFEPDEKNQVPYSFITA